MSTVKGLELASLYQLDLEVAKRLEAEVFLKVRDSFNPMPDIPIGRGRRPVDPQPLSPLTMDADEDPATFHIRSRAHQEETEARKLSYDTATFGYVGALEWAYAFQLRYDLELESRFNTASYESHRMATMANASTSGVTTRGDASKTSHKNNDVETAIDANGVHFVRRQPGMHPCVSPQYSGIKCTVSMLPLRDERKPVLDRRREGVGAVLVLCERGYQLR